MKFHIYYNEYNEPLAHVEMDALDLVTVSSALHGAVQKRIEWINEQSDGKFADDRMRAFGDLAAINGAFDLIQQTIWPLHESFINDMGCDCECEEDEDEDSHA